MIHGNSIHPFALWFPFFFKEDNLIEVTHVFVPFEYDLPLINVIIIL